MPSDIHEWVMEPVGGHDPMAICLNRACIAAVERVPSSRGAIVHTMSGLAFRIDEEYFLVAAWFSDGSTADETYAEMDKQERLRSLLDS